VRACLAAQVKNQDYCPSPELALGLARPTSEGRPLYELVMPRRPICEELSVVPADAEFVATRGTADSMSRLGELAHLEALWANPATNELFEACARAPALRAIHVTHFKSLDVVRLAGANRLEHLMLSWAPKLVDLSFVRDLPALRVLYLNDMKRIDLSTLPELPSLRGLFLGGTMWGTLKVESLAPLTRLPGLRYLGLSNVRPMDGSLKPLATLIKLRELELPNFFEVGECARLAAALPHTRSSALTPFFTDYRERGNKSSVFHCGKCGDGKVMMTGKPAVVLCHSCDDAKIRQRVLRWEGARLSSWTS
jgi:hypothetical protein